MNNATTTEIVPFPKLQERPKEEQAIGPIHLLTIHLLSIIDQLSGKLFVDALPLIGGEEAKEELESWRIGVKTEDDSVFREKKALSMYTTFALGAFGIGKSISAHVSKSQADAIKAIFEVSNMYDTYKPCLFDCKKTLKSKDLTPMEKLDALWAVLDVFYEEQKTRITKNAKEDEESLKKVIEDLNQIFMGLEKLTGCAAMIGILKKGLGYPDYQPNNNNSNI